MSCLVFAMCCRRLVRDGWPLQKRTANFRITMGPSDDATRCRAGDPAPLYYLQETARATPRRASARSRRCCARAARSSARRPRRLAAAAARAAHALAGRRRVTGVLRWPTGTARAPSCRSCARPRTAARRLLATLPTHYLQRAAVLADAEGSADAAAVAAIGATRAAPKSSPARRRRPGRRSRLPRDEGGPFIDEYEGLARGHLDKGSAQAALSRASEANLFGAWGRPFAFHARMLAGLGRDEEARDLARQALSMPLWTLGDDLAEVCAIAQTTVEKLAATCRLRADGGLTPEQLRAQNGMDKRTKEQVALDKASYLLDLAVASPDDYSWESIRPELQQLYTEAKQVDVARQVGPIA